MKLKTMCLSDLGPWRPNHEHYRARSSLVIRHFIWLC